MQGFLVNSRGLIKPKCHWNSVEASENLNHFTVSHFTVSLKGKKNQKQKKRETENPSHLVICSWLL